MRLSSVLVLGLGLLLSPAALAKKIPEIKKTGISEFDPTFMKAKAIHDDLDTVHGSLKSANQNLAATLALPKETKLSDSLAELKKRAGNKVETVLEDGRWPKLQATDALPSDVAAGVEAVNSLVDSLKNSEQTLVGMPDAARAVLASAEKFPSQLGLDLLTKNDLSAGELPSVAKKLKNNLKAIKATPERVERVTKQSTNMAGQVLEVFPAK